MGGAYCARSEPSALSRIAEITKPYNSGLEREWSQVRRSQSLNRKKTRVAFMICPCGNNHSPKNSVKLIRVLSLQITRFANPLRNPANYRIDLIRLWRKTSP